MGKDGRGLDHLMEQNETELDFLSAYGGVDDGKKGDGHALLSALQRFLRAGGLEADLNDSTLNFAWGSARVEDDVVGVGDGDERNYGEQQTQRGEGGRHFAHRPASQLWSSTRAAREMHRLPRRTLELLLLLEGKSGSGSN